MNECTKRTECYAGECDEAFDSHAAVEKHMRVTRDAAHDPTNGFREESRV